MKKLIVGVIVLLVAVGTLGPYCAGIASEKVFHRLTNRLHHDRRWRRVYRKYRWSRGQGVSTAVVNVRDGRRVGPGITAKDAGESQRRIRRCIDRLAILEPLDRRRRAARGGQVQSHGLACVRRNTGGLYSYRRRGGLTERGCEGK